MDCPVVRRGGNDALVGSDDPVDLQVCVLLTVPIAAAIVLPPLHLEYDDLVGFSVADDGGLHRCTLDRRRTDVSGCVATYEQDIGEGLFGAFVSVEARYTHSGTFFDLELVATDANDGVHAGFLFCQTRGDLPTHVGGQKDQS